MARSEILYRHLYRHPYEIYKKFIEKISVKRIFDVFFSLFILLITSPLMVIILCGIKMSSRGKIFYIQNRLGKQGKIFKCIKFRTMHEEAEGDLEKILSHKPDLKKEWEEKQKLSLDPRIFSFGYFLRKTSLDELPQFVNVLKGDLSVVGPRPYMLNQEKILGNYAPIILSVRPGITGIWQTSGRSQMPFHQRILLDASYIKKKSFLFDLLLIIKTIPALFSSEDAC